jgi:hypothetical protein
MHRLRMGPRRGAIGRTLTAVVVVVVVVIAVGIGLYITTAPHPIYCCTTTSTSSTLSTTTTLPITNSGPIVTTQSQTTTTFTTRPTSICMSPGQPLGVFLRVLNDSTSLPLVAANVTAVADGYSSNCGIATVSAFDWQSTYIFMTNNTEWYSLNVVNVDSYQFTVTYSGHTYNFVLAPISLSTYTCGTLSLPSGKTNITTSYETSCAS